MATPPACPECNYDPPDTACDECGAEPGEKCRPLCTAPDGDGGPHQHHDPTTHDYGQNSALPTTPESNGNP
jgi:hypothetical protein